MEQLSVNIETPDDYQSSSESTPILRRTFSRIDNSLSGRPDEPENMFGSSSGERKKRSRTLTTIPGVFCPVALSMFSVALFLRMGFIVGQAGVLQTIALFALSFFILEMTVLSVCAISTNGAIEGGGAYYMISRALGPEFGGSIGILFFLGNVIASAAYCSGLVEAITLNFGHGGIYSSSLPDGRWWCFLYASGINLFDLVICLVGASFFSKTVTVIFGVVVFVVLSVVVSVFAVHQQQVQIPATNSLVYTNASAGTIYGNYTGFSLDTFLSNLYPQYSLDYTTSTKMDFATVFGILFSSVTGIMSGANMSGDLKNPSHSIPRGTVSATLFVLVVYLLVSILLAFTCDRYLLLNDNIVLQGINFWGPLIVIGIFAATLSAALSCLMVGSRLLEAVVEDDLFGVLLRPLGKKTASGNPYMAVLCSFVLTELTLLIGEMNAIAPIVSIFYLLAYFAVNLSCLALELASAPNFRPTFRLFSWHTALLGMIGSLVMTFIVNPIYGAVANTLCVVIIAVLHFQDFPPQWGSISQALIFHQVRKYLLLLDPRKEHVKFWRPQILLLVSNPRSSIHLIEFANDIKKGGLYVLGNVKLGSLEDSIVDPCTTEYPVWLDLVNRMRIKAFVELTLAQSVHEGVHQLLRLSGLGGMKPNTIIVGFYDNSLPEDELARHKFPTKPSSKSLDIAYQFQDLRTHQSDRDISPADYVMILRDTLKLHKNICIARNFHTMDRDAVLRGKRNLYIDVWPVNLFHVDIAESYDTSCLFILQLACILNMVSTWRKRTTLRVMMLIRSDSTDTDMRKSKLRSLLVELRIKAEIVPVLWDQVDTFKTEQTQDWAAKDEGDSGEFRIMPKSYLEATNDMIKKHATNTVVCFLYLPRPPPVDQTSPAVYLQALSQLTNELPPSLMVHGVSTVTSTHL